jgi:hypothetical protein
MASHLGRWIAFGSVFLFAAAAEAAQARVVVIPVVVGAGPEPTPQLVAAFGEGLRANPAWTIVQGEALRAPSGAPALKPEDLARLTAKLDEAAARQGAEAVAAIEPVRGELLEAAKKGPLDEAGAALAVRAGAALAAALAANGQADRARVVAQETALLFPGRKPDDAAKLTPEVAGAFTTTGLGAKLTLKTNPEGCEVLVNGAALGKAPVDLAAQPGAVYWAQARCGAAAPGGQPLTTAPKRIAVGVEETARQEVLDAAFERLFQAEGGARLRYASPADRRQLEEGYARSLADRFDAEAVVLTSVGEMSGADWITGRMYLRSGHLNREGLARLEISRANALGRYLATGKDVPGVLPPSDAGALAAAAERAPRDGSPPPHAAWYTDIPGWGLVGAGVVGLGLGTWQNRISDRKRDEADAIRGGNQFDRQQRLYNSAQTAKFWGGVGTIGGGIMIATGVLLLAIPEYQTAEGDLFVLSPLLGRGGSGLVMSGRF